jgi:tetratricopeptide (TPR) repeat protein
MSTDIAKELDNLGKSSRRSALISTLGIGVLIATQAFAVIKLRSARDELRELESQSLALRGENTALDKQNRQLEEQRQKRDEELKNLDQLLAAKKNALSDIVELTAKGDSATLGAIRDKAGLQLGDAYKFWQQGYAAFTAGKRAEAERLYRASIQADASYAPPYNSLGRLALEAGDAEPAKQWFLKAVERRPDYAPALDNIAIIEYQRGNRDEAIRWNQKALEARPAYDKALALQRVLKSK